NFGHAARLNGGWFVDQTFSADAGYPQRLTLSIKYVDWQGQHWAASRAGNQFIHTSLDDPSTPPFVSDLIKYTNTDRSQWTARLIQPTAITFATGQTPTNGWYNVANSGTHGLSVQVAARNLSGITGVLCADNGNLVQNYSNATGLNTAAATGT